ncbi:MAG: hypothetical protein J6Q48_04165, partial [Bacteroidaceae bacterium]|nr:hypothetical protein [Bacteroidaceae bacterium]
MQEQNYDYQIEHTQPIPAQTTAAETQNNFCVGGLYPILYVKRAKMLQGYDAEIYSHTIGNACLINGLISSQSGLVMCSSVDLSGVPATVEEINAIKQALGKGVYVGRFSCVGSKSVIGKDTQIYPQVYIGDNVTIGENCILYPGVKVYDGCKIGNNCILHANVVIGSDGFGFAPTQDGSYKKIPQTGNVILEDDVEIGSNTVVDRATMGSTIV